MIWLYAALLVLWGNLATLLGRSARLPGGSVEFAVAGVALIVVSIAFLRALRLDAAALGMRGGRDAQAVLLGSAIGLVAALAAVGALRLLVPPIVGRHVEYAPLMELTDVQLAVQTAVLLPIGVVIPEEFAFRGVLLGGLLRRLRTRDALVVSGLVFSLWHLAVAVATIDNTTFAPPSPWFAPAVVAALVAVLVGGAAFAWLRLRTRSLATTMAAHWVFNAAILVSLWVTQPRAVPNA
jgi:membrane protease YdiL (CAAX protease family)